MGRGKGGMGRGKGGAIRKRVTKRSVVIEVSDPLITTKRSRDELSSWIKINDIKQDLNDQVLSVCIDPILKLFGSNADLLQYLTNYSSKSKLDQMYAIISETMQEFRISDKNIYLTQNKKSKNALFGLISDESTVNICSFLSRDDIIRFKSVSRRIGIICLNEMNKCRVAICLSKYLLNSKHRKALEWKHKATNNRYSVTTTFSSIFEHQEKNNNFSEKYQIPILVDKNGHHHNIKRFDQIHPESLLIMFDKRELSILDCMNNREMRENDIFCYDTHCILALYYFDIYNQEISLMKYLVIDNSITSIKLKEYIKTKLIENAMNLTLTYPTNSDPNNYNIDNIVQIYGLHDHFRFHCDKIMEDRMFKNKKTVSLIFQIGANMISYNRQNRKIEYEVSELKSFRCKYGNNQYSDDNKIGLKWCSEQLVDLKEQIKCYMMTTNQSKQVLNDIMHEIDTKYAKKYKFIIDTSLNINILRHHLSRFMFKNVIPAKYIEIYRNTSCNVLDDFRCNVSNISLGIVPYNATNTRFNARIFQICLYPQQQAPFPFTSNKIDPKPIKISIKINSTKKCSVDQIVQEIIKISKNPFFSHQSKEIEETLNNYINATNPNCYVIIKDYKLCEEEEEDTLFNYRFRRHYEPRSYYQKYQILYHLQSTECIKELGHKNEKIVNLNVLMLPNILNDVKKYQIMIRFAWKDRFNEDINTEHALNAFIGLPLFVYCDEKDTLHDILINNQIIQKYKNDISKIYQVVHEGEIILAFSKKERNSFKIYDLLSEDFNGFIVITLKHRDDIDVSSRWINNVVASQHDSYYKYS